MNEVKLVLPSEEYKNQYEELINEYCRFGETFLPWPLSYGRNGFKRAVRLTENYRLGKGLRFGEVPCTTFWMTDAMGTKIYGSITIRHRLNSRYMKKGGHIGYGVRPCERRKGYAVKMLALGLDKCRGMGFDHVYIDCVSENTGSSRTIINNGGVLERSLKYGKGNILRYRIDLYKQA